MSPVFSLSWITIRRPLDFIIACVLLLSLFPVIIITAGLIRLDGGPVFFLQPRLGRDANIFKIYKFRSMIVNADQYLDENGIPTRDRITKIGYFIRRTSIDELPQLINVLRGEMSMIGPRPILPHMQIYMTAAERKRFLIRPGITGLAQVEGRNMIPWSERFVLDVKYIESASPLRDFVILIYTIQKVFTSSGIANDRNASDVDDVTTRKLH